MDRFRSLIEGGALRESLSGLAGVRRSADAYVSPVFFRFYFRQCFLFVLVDFNECACFLFWSNSRFSFSVS